MLLTGEFAYKLKKPVRFSFVDFSTPELRKRFCDEELRLNRRLAPELYLDVVPIGGTRDRPRIGATPAIEHAVKMQQFTVEHTLERIIEEDDIRIADVHALAQRISDFQAGLAPVSGPAPAESVVANLEELQEVIDERTRAQLRPAADWMFAQAHTLGPVFRERERAGRIAEGHGDMHLANLVRIDGAIVPFDCIEFNRDLRCIDTIDEVAFTVMDFMAHRRADLGFELLNRYLELTGDYAGVRVLRFYGAHRALVRARVRLLPGPDDSGAQSFERAMPWLTVAQALASSPRPLLVITHGLSGSGKTTVTNELIGRLPAIRIRSDVVRKRLHAMAPQERSGSPVGGGLYSDHASEATYAELRSCAEAALCGGINVIVDAACLRRSQRDGFATIASRQDADFAIVDVTASASVLRQRVAERYASRTDASEADIAVLEHQLEIDEPVDGNEQHAYIRVDTGGRIDADALAQQIERCCGRLQQGGR